MAVKTVGTRPVIPWKWKSVAQTCPTLCNLVAFSLPGSSVHGILQARILEWAAFSFSRGSYWLSDWTQVSCITGRFFTIWDTRAGYFVNLLTVVLVFFFFFFWYYISRRGLEMLQPNAAIGDSSPGFPLGLHWHSERGLINSEWGWAFQIFHSLHDIVRWSHYCWQRWKHWPFRISPLIHASREGEEYIVAKWVTAPAPHMVSTYPTDGVEAQSLVGTKVLVPCLVFHDTTW